MYKFSARSQDKLNECHTDLQRLFNEVIKHIDCTVITGYRSEESQNEAFRSGTSKLCYPSSKHNMYPSMAIDVVPYVNGIDWENKERFRQFIGWVLGIASQMGIAIRSGGDWDRDNDFSDQCFMDLPHFELID